jgi:hypothetical protein
MMHTETGDAAAAQQRCADSRKTEAMLRQTNFQTACATTRFEVQRAVEQPISRISLDAERLVKLRQRAGRRTTWSTPTRHCAE